VSGRRNFSVLVIASLAVGFSPRWRVR
jgi:hypothetical protein